MRTPPRRSLLAAGILAAGAAALAFAALALASEAPVPPERWRSAFDSRADVDVGGRLIVVLAAESLADRVRANGKLPPPAMQRRLVRRAERFQRRLLSELRDQGVVIRPEHTYTRTFNGFSAVLGARALAALERSPGVVGVYPVRAVHPATVTEVAITEAELGEDSGRHPAIGLPGRDGTGVTIAVLDTGVDARHPALSGHVLPGIDLVAGGGDGSRPESHGTRMAGLLVGRAPLRGVAPGAVVLPIRVLGPSFTRDGVAYAGRSDVLLEGFERAVDPDGDGDLVDAADVALAAVVEPYASFADSPEARAVAGTLRLGTLVVAAAGNDGAGSVGSGTIGAPGGAPAALTVGAVDTRDENQSVQVTLTAGGRRLLAGPARVLGALAPAEGSTLAGSEVAVIPADGSALVPRVREAASGGARAVLVYGSGLPAGALDLEESSAVPVLAVAIGPGERARASLEAGVDVSVSFGAVTSSDNASAGHVAPFSSRGPAVDGGLKPDLVAPGVGLVTADAGSDEDGLRFATVTGSSAAAATVAGAAALLAEARPKLDAGALRSALVGAGRPVEGVTDVAAHGAGLVDVEAAAGAALAAEPATLSATAGPGARSLVTLELRNLSTRPLGVELALEPDAGSDLSLAGGLEQLTVRAGARRAIELELSLPRAAAAGAGMVVVSSGGTELTRVPVIVTRPSSSRELVGVLDLSADAFRPSDASPAVLTFRAGIAERDGEGLAIEPVALLEVELLNARGRRLGVLARLRDLLPGRYSLGLTGRGPSGSPLPPGRYSVRLTAEPASVGEGAASRPSTATVPFRIVRP